MLSLGKAIVTPPGPAFWGTVQAPLEEDLRPDQVLLDPLVDHVFLNVVELDVPRGEELGRDFREGLDHTAVPRRRSRAARQFGQWADLPAGPQQGFQPVARNHGPTVLVRAQGRCGGAEDQTGLGEDRPAARTVRRLNTALHE